MSAHTPGPWTYDDSNVTGPNAEAIAQLFDACEFPCYDEDDHAALEAEVCANGRLIAAAPDLLAALEDVRDNVRGDSPEMWQRVFAAIAKARPTAPTDGGTEP